MRVARRVHPSLMLDARSSPPAVCGSSAPAVPLREVTTRSRRGGPAPKMPLPTFWLTPAQRAEKARQRRMAALAQVAEQPVGGTAEGSEREKSPSMQEMLASFAEEINAE